LVRSLMRTTTQALMVCPTMKPANPATISCVYAWTMFSKCSWLG
jgi:hypothetical protein